MTLGARGVIYDTSRNSLLLVRHSYSEGWELPGGGVEVGESALAALKHELAEETGIICESADVLGIYHNESVSKRDHVVLYLVEHWSSDGPLPLPNLEIVDSKWFELAGLPSDLTPCASCGIDLLTSKRETASVSP